MDVHRWDFAGYGGEEGPGTWVEGEGEKGIEVVLKREILYVCIASVGWWDWIACNDDELFDGVFRFSPFFSGWTLLLSEPVCIQIVLLLSEV